MELRCSYSLALALGAVGPKTIDEHRGLKKTGHLLVRDPQTGQVLFWPWAMSSLERMAESVARWSR
jgi:hypothetical protein